MENNSKIMTCENYDEEIHKLFESAFIIRCNPESTAGELYSANDTIDNALSLCSSMELISDDSDTKIEIINNRLRCYIERIAIYTRLMKMFYNTPQFEKVSKKQEYFCKIYMNVYTHIIDDLIQQSQYQLKIMAYQSLASNYFHRGGMGIDRNLCLKAIEFIDKAIEHTKDDDEYNNILCNNKSKILSALNP